MLIIRTLFCLVDIKKHSFLTSCVFSFVFLNVSSPISDFSIFSFSFYPSAGEWTGQPESDRQAGRQADRQVDSQVDRQTNTEARVGSELNKHRLTFPVTSQ